MRNPILMVLLFVAPSVFWTGARFYKHLEFNREVAGHLKRAADANSIEIAVQELEIAVSGMEARGLTRGYTSLLYPTPDEDIGFWYMNTKAALTSLKSLSTSASETDRETKLLKLRQTLLDHSNGGEGVTAPNGVEIYPKNWAWFALGVLCVVPWGSIFLSCR